MTISGPLRNKYSPKEAGKSVSSNFELDLANTRQTVYIDVETK